MTSAEARKKSLAFAHRAEISDHHTASITRATLALFWQREADRLEEDENINVILGRDDT